MTQKQLFSITMNRDLVHTLDKLADSLGMSRSALVNYLVRMGLAEMPAKISARDLYNINHGEDDSDA